MLRAVKHNIHSFQLLTYAFSTQADTCLFRQIL